MCRTGAAAPPPQGDATSRHSHSAETGTDVRELLLGYSCFTVLTLDLAVGTVVHVKQRCSLQDEDAAGHVCDLA